MFGVGLDVLSVFARQKGLTVMSDIRENLENGHAAVPGDNAGSNGPTNKFGQQRSRTIKKSAFISRLDLHSCYQFMRPGSKDRSIRWSQFIEVNTAGIDHLKDMKISELADGNLKIRHKFSNRGPHDGEIYIQPGQRTVKIENDSLDGRGIQFMIHLISFR